MLPEKMKHHFDGGPPARLAAEKLGRLWCASMHGSPMWPIHSQYRCRTCGRHYAVSWGVDQFLPAPSSPTTAAQVPMRTARVPSFRSALLPLGIMLAILLASTLRAANDPTVESTALADAAFARYTASLEQATPWNLETIEIDASLPKLEKKGRLRAIRRLLPFGKPEYQVLEIAGDQTVKQQVIVRYLSAEVRAAEIPASTTAITPANYRFRYNGFTKTGDTVAYIFLISPRKKRAGLIKGELWLDGETGAVIRQSGYLVKNPSIFVKRIDVTRETDLRAGIAQMRVTHVSVDTRLVGRAELIIQEWPYTSTDGEPAPGISDR
jgi:hypothetical protein